MTSLIELPRITRAETKRKLILGKTVMLLHLRDRTMFPLLSKMLFNKTTTGMWAHFLIKSLVI
jgi:hypothetical protein